MSLLPVDQIKYIFRPLMCRKEHVVIKYFYRNEKYITPEITLKID